MRQAADGSCTGAPVDLTAASTYTIAENDFMATGGDGYPNVYARGTTQDIMDQVLADYITANTPDQPGDPGPHRLHDQRRDCLPGGDAVTPQACIRGRGRGSCLGFAMIKEVVAGRACRPAKIV